MSDTIRGEPTNGESCTKAAAVRDGMVVGSVVCADVVEGPVAEDGEEKLKRGFLRLGVEELAFPILAMGWA